MDRARVAVPIALLVLGVAAACGDSGGAGGESSTEPSESSPSESTQATPTDQVDRTEDAEPATTPPEATGTRIVVADSEFGPMLFDERQQAIYLFDVETSTKPACYDDCATAWPPVLTDGKPVAGDDVRPGLLGTTRRADGSVQVTYGGHPLYFYAHEGPGEVKCHDVFLNGGNWYVVQPDGDRAP